MKVQGINNPNSISHKAYFKPNAEFKNLWAIRPMNSENYFEKLEKVKYNLPSHQLEIIDSGRAFFDEKIKDYYLIFNNFTNKSFGVAIEVSSVKNHLEEVLDSLLEKNEKTVDFFNFTKDSSKFHEITNK